MPITPSILVSFLYRQFFTTPTYPTTDCTGKTLIVTGANTGLGKEAARHLVRLNADKVIITSRDPKKGEAAKRDIEASTNRSGVVEVWQLNLEDYDNVKAFAQRVNGLKRVDGIIENAGKATDKFDLVGGNESTVTVNDVSTMLLALLLLPKLQESAKLFDITPNITIVSSEVHFFANFAERKGASIFDTLNNPETSKMGDRYNVSKLLEVYACREIAREHPVSQTLVTLNFLNPGFCHSELMRENDNFATRLFKQILARTTEVGSRTLVHGGLAGPETHGKYLDCCKITKCADIVEGKEGPELQRKVWSELSQKLNEIQPGVTKVLDA